MGKRVLFLGGIWNDSGTILFWYVFISIFLPDINIFSYGPTTICVAHGIDSF